MTNDHKFKIKYSVHCQCENFFGKETIVKNVMNELHAKVELRAYCEKNYAEFEFIKISSCEEVDPEFDKWYNDFLNIFKTKLNERD
jgi:hypothetical protein